MTLILSPVHDPVIISAVLIYLIFHNSPRGISSFCIFPSKSIKTICHSGLYESSSSFRGERYWLNSCYFHAVGFQSCLFPLHNSSWAQKEKVLLFNPHNNNVIVEWIAQNQHPGRYLIPVSLATQSPLQVRWDAPFFKCAQRLWRERNIIFVPMSLCSHVE